jgi:hypothetical protein
MPIPGDDTFIEDELDDAAPNEENEEDEDEGSEVTEVTGKNEGE